MQSQWRGMVDGCNVGADAKTELRGTWHEGGTVLDERELERIGIELLYYKVRGRWSYIYLYLRLAKRISPNIHED